MTARLRSVVAPAYLFLCLLFGGSAQGVSGNAFLRLAAILLIAWALIQRREEPLSRGVRQLLVIIVLGLVLALLYLIPMPTDLWAKLPGRENLASGFQLLGIEPGKLPASLAPYDSVAALLALLPPLGMLAAMIAFHDYRRAWLTAALIAGTLGGVLLGIMQVTSPDPTTSPWYLYRQSNFGVATGFFANGNHMASLLLVTIPFIVALAVKVRERTKDLKLRSTITALAGGVLIVVILGLVLNGSLVGYGLGVPVVIASLLMASRRRSRFSGATVLVIGLGSLVALALLWANPVGGKLGGLGAETSVSSRQEILSNSLDLIRQFGPVGTGPGTFQKTYPLQEDPATVDRYYVNHAHNDYLELAVETGLPGIVLMLLFLAWWLGSVRAMLRSPAADQHAFAGAIASAAVLLHSAVDYPLRTAAIGAVFAMSLVLLLQSRRTAKSETDLRPARHLGVG